MVSVGFSPLPLHLSSLQPPASSVPTSPGPAPYLTFAVFVGRVRTHRGDTVIAYRFHPQTTPVRLRSVAAPRIPDWNFRDRLRTMVRSVHVADSYQPRPPRPAAAPGPAPRICWFHNTTP
eukprot:7186429-Prymnesium_polylepis.4